MSFDRLVTLYEETRVFNLEAFNSALTFLENKFPPNIFHELFEPGIGTGRIAIPLAQRGYRVTGIDISQEMLGYLDSKVANLTDNTSIVYQKADVTKIPFPDNNFDIVIAVHLFYFIKEWKKAINEIIRILKPSGTLVLMHTGTGMEIPSLNQKYKELCLEKGFQFHDVGVKSTIEVTEYLDQLGWHTEFIKDRWLWSQTIQIDKAIEYMRLRAYSFTKDTPCDIHKAVIERLVSEFKHQYGTLDIEIEIPNQISYVFASVS